METQISYYTAVEILRAVEQKVVVAKDVTVTIGRSDDYPDYPLQTSHCYVISIKGQLVFAIDIELRRLIYFLTRANTLSVML